MNKFFLNLDEVRRLALNKGLSVKELTKAAGISYQVIITAQKGGKTETKNVCKIAEALDCIPEEIVKEE